MKATLINHVKVRDERVGNKQQLYNFTTLKQLARDFMADMETWKKEHPP